MQNSKDLLNDMKKHTLDGVPYYPRDELPSAVDDAANIMSAYDKYADIDDDCDSCKI